MIASDLTAAEAERRSRRSSRLSTISANSSRVNNGISGGLTMSAANEKNMTTSDSPSTFITAVPLKPGTPRKTRTIPKNALTTNSRSDVRESGGLTPLPAEEDDELSASLYISSSRPQSSLSVTSATEYAAKKKNIAESEVGENVEKVEHQDNQYDELEALEKVNVEDMLKDDHFLDQYLPKEDDPIAEKIEKGMEAIKALDRLLQEKTKLAKQLEKQRLAVENNVSSNNTEEESDDENDDNTAPKEVEKDKPTQAPTDKVEEPDHDSKLESGKNEHDTDSTKSNSENQNGKLKDYNKGNFIQRNIVLGGDARYYHAMTDVEKDRVENLLQVEDDVDLISVDGSSIVSKAWTLPVGTGFFPGEQDLERLAKIDNKLQTMLPATEWEDKSIVWSNFSDTTSLKSSLRSAGLTSLGATSWQSSSSLRAPSLPAFAFYSSVAGSVHHGWQSDKGSMISGFGGSTMSRKTVDDVMHQNVQKEFEALHDDQKKMDEIDHKLLELQEQELRPPTQDDISRLVIDAMKLQNDLKSHADWETGSIDTNHTRPSSRGLLSDTHSMVCTNASETSSTIYSTRSTTPTLSFHQQAEMSHDIATLSINDNENHLNTHEGDANSDSSSRPTSTTPTLDH